MKRDQAVGSQEMKNPSSLSKVQPMTITSLSETKEDNQLPRTSKGKSVRTEFVEQRNNALPAQRHHEHERN
jgi:hypothetical protein